MAESHGVARGRRSVRSGRPHPREESGRGDCDRALYRVIVPAQDLVVRLNGRDLDAPAEHYLPAVRPYGILRMAWALWRDVPGAEPKEALSLARRVRRKGEAEVLTAAGFLAEHVGGRLLARHRLVARLERADRQP